jgi:hypothetical protein
MASSTPKTILLEVNGAERPIFEKLVVTTAVTPGDLLSISTAGKVAPYNGAAGATNKMFALENPYAATSTSAAIDQDYAVGDLCRFVFAQPGDLVYAWLADSQTATIGSPLVSTTTAGHLGVGTVDASLVEGALVGFADEAVTTSGAVARIKVRIA